MKATQLKQSEFQYVLKHRFPYWDNQRKKSFINSLIHQDKFELIKEYFGGTRVKQYYTEIYNGRVELKNARIENYKKQIKELKKEIKEDNAMINKLNQNL